MFFRIEDLQLRHNHAGFKRCHVTHVDTRNLAPFGTAYPAEAHGEAEVIVVCGRWKGPNEEVLGPSGGDLDMLNTWVGYGFGDYQSKVRPDTFLTRIPQTTAEFERIPGFEDWSKERVEMELKAKGFLAFLMPRRLIFNQAKGQWDFDFICSLDTQLPDKLFSVSSDKDLGIKFASPRPPGPGVLSPDEIPISRPAPVSATSRHWWVKDGRLAGMPVPGTGEIPGLKAAGLQAVVGIGVDIDEAALAAEGIGYLSLDLPDEWTPDGDQIQRFAEFYKNTQGAVAVCSLNMMATGTMLGVALVSEGLPVEEALECIESVQPAALESSGQVEFLYVAAAMLGFDPV
ncbi:protein-tyrosine phosphatase family protein [Luteolibacter marinus]|uniref:protein-tyrosine phosphatase family protein n=1 Tax=Luteolibacter marinus TaxID=2776705 RepID=UPI001866DF03|nr:hypothetical protein [Luteolibacter marinus]